MVRAIGDAVILGHSKAEDATQPMIELHSRLPDAGWIHTHVNGSSWPQAGLDTNRVCAEKGINALNQNATVVR